MSAKQIVVLVGKIVLLTFLYFICMTVGSRIFLADLAAQVPCRTNSRPPWALPW